MTFETKFQQRHPGINPTSIQSVLKLAEEGATIPFMARYRKEATGNLDEVAIGEILKFKEAWDEMTKRKEFILKEVGEQGKLTEELKAEILAVTELTLLEDIYLPYKKKKQTKAQKAKESGLEPLADWLWASANGTAGIETVELSALANRFVNAERGITDSEAALMGARDILTEKIAETLTLRQKVREQVFKTGLIKTTKGEKAKDPSKFQDYFDYQEPIASLKKEQSSHRYLAIRRGAAEEEIKYSLFLDENTENSLAKAFEDFAIKVAESPAAEILRAVARVAYKGYVLPSIENEVHKTLKENADTAAIRVFAENVRKLLLAPPFGAKAVLGIDPGFRTGCKVAIVDSAGKYLANFVFHLHSETEKTQLGILIGEFMKNASIEAVAIGNGTAGRETENFLRETFKEKKITVPIVMVSESGASVYSASEVAREEFPDLDLTVRGAISIARRLQDPLAELVKVDPKSIGVGQYQHDVSSHQLKKSLEGVVDSCVNSVGVDLNTASPYLLARVSGIGPALARTLVEHRKKKGLYKARTDLLKVPRFSEKSFELAAGFLRIPKGDNPLDRTGVHPERYAALESFAESVGKKVGDLVGPGVETVRSSETLKELLGPFTFKDVIEELEKPGRDPREKFEIFNFREDINKVADLKPEMMCPGIVTNVANFGAFVDIGVHQDGLVHISELADRFVKDPHEIVSVGERVMVRVTEVDVVRSRISLSMRSKNQEPPQPKMPPAPRPRPQPKRPAEPRPEARNQNKEAKSVPPKKPQAPHRPQPRPAPRPRASQNLTQNPFAALAVLKNLPKDK